VLKRIYVLVTLNTYIDYLVRICMENKHFTFQYRGQFAACSFNEMEHHIYNCSRGNWKIATLAQTLKYSPMEENAICWTSTKNLWTPEGVIVFDDPEGNMPKDEKSLMSLYQQGNPSVRYVKKGFKDDEMSISDFVKNPLIVAQVGNEDLTDLIYQRARAINSEKTFMLNEYLNKTPSPIKSTALDSWGLRGKFMHIYCNVSQSGPIGSIYGYMLKID
jgi:hypothetical protein